MPISMGIMCEKCGTVYLIGAKASNRFGCLPRSMGPGIFTLTCTTCGPTRSFHKNDLKPYTISAARLWEGYAQRGEYSTRQDLAQILFRNPRR